MTPVTAPLESRIGIDMGTTHTVAALSGADGRSQPLLFDASFLLPSAVYAETDGRLLVGRDAERSAKVDPSRYEPNPKRRIDDGSVLLGNRDYPVSDLIAAVLRRAGDEAARVAGQMPARTVLTYPADWAGSRKAVLAEAAGRAGLPQVTLVPEPIAAALYFTSILGRQVPPGAALVVYDFGGGTFDTSVLRRRPDNGWDVLVSDGLDDVGGVDLDAAVIDHLRDTVGAQHPDQWRSLVEPADDNARRRHRMLWDEVRSAKEQLSRTSSAVVHVPLFDTDAYLTREEFERISRPYLERTVDLAANALQRAGVRHDQIAGLFPVGGSSRIPMVTTLLHHRLGVAPTLIEQPELVVALGSVLAVGPAPSRPFPAPPAWGPPRAGFATAPPRGLPSNAPVSGPAAMPVSGPSGSVPVSGPVPVPIPVSVPPSPAGVSPAAGPAGPVSAPPGAGPATTVGFDQGPGSFGGTAAATAAMGAEAPPVTGYPAPPPLGTATPGGYGRPPVKPTGRRTAILATLIVVVLLVLGGGTALAWNLASSVGKNNRSTGSGSTAGTHAATGAQGNGGAAAGGTGTGAGTQHVVVGKTVWYAGTKLTFGAVDLTTGSTPQITVDVLVENLTTKDVGPDVDLQLTVDGKGYPAQAKDTNNIAAGQKTQETYEIQAYGFTGKLADGVFTLGDAKKAQAKVPVAGNGTLVAWQPKHVLDSTKVGLRDLSVTFTTCDLRGGFFDFHGQADAGYQALTCSVDLQYTGNSGGGHYVGEGNFRLGLPDGTEIGPTVAPNEALYSADVKPGTDLGFQIKSPPKGVYLLRLVDVHGGETRSASMVKEIPITF